MLHRFIGAWLLASAIAFGVSASAQPVQRSGATYHVPVCPGPMSKGAARCHAHVVTDSRGNPLKGPPVAGVSYTASDLRAAYSIPYDSTTPTGPLIAIVDAYGYPTAESDLATYRTKMGLPACRSGSGCFTKIDQTGGASYPTYNLGWAQETALDLDMVSAICPTCRILLVEADSNSFADLAAAETTAAAYNAIAISNSYGGGETGSTTYASAYVNPTGVVTASTGDSGYGVSFPASAPTVTAVGGTSLKRANSGARGWSETAWSGAGSGCSAVYARRSFQNPAVADAVPSTTCSKRAVADVSAVADPNTGVQVFGPTRSSGSQWLVFGGTSVAAPLVAGVYGVGAIDGVTPDVANPYGAYSFGHVDAAQLNDVTSGSNGSCGSTALCAAKAGWDGPSGLGTPHGDPAF
jgi:subtilase family serine protease